MSETKLFDPMVDPSIEASSEELSERNNLLRKATLKNHDEAVQSVQEQYKAFMSL